MFKPGDSYAAIFTTSASTGAAADADSLPTATADHVGGGTGAFALTVTHMATGIYRVTGTLPGTFAKGDVLNIYASATIGGIVTAACIDRFVVDSKRIGDLNDSSYVGGAVASVTGSVGSVTAPVSIALSQAIPTTGNTANTVADCLNAARAQGFGPWAIVGTTLNLYAADGVTVVHAFTLNSSSSPTSRT